MPQLVNRQVVLASVNGTPTATDAVFCENLQFQYIDIKSFEREGLRSSSVGMLQNCMVTYRGQLSFTTEIKGSGGGAGQSKLPEVDALLQMSGHSRTSVANVSETYTFSANPVILGDVIFYYDNYRLEMSDVSATLDTSLASNTYGKDNWTLTGNIIALPAGTTQPVPLYDQVKPVALNGISFTYGTAVIPNITEITWNISNEIAGEEDLTSTTGFGKPYILSRGPIVGNFDPLMDFAVVGLQIGWHSEYLTNQLRALNIGIIGTAEGNRVKFDMPSVSIVSIAHTERNKQLAWNIGIRFNETVAGNDEISRVYT